MLRVEDDGVGGARPSAHGNGLRTMRQRAEELDGSFVITELRPGTRVDVVLPVGAEP